MKSAFLLDMDGVLYHGDRALSAAITFIEAIANHPFTYLTNNPSKTACEISNRLARLGFPAPDEGQVITSAHATARYLALEKPGFRYYAVGGPGLLSALATVGQSAETAVDYVVIGEGEGIDYAAITRGINLLREGAQLVSTNPDASVDHDHGLLPGGGALVAPFAIASGCTPLTVGKPFSLLYEMAMERLNSQAEHCIMVGDRPDTDIAGAARLGMRTALVRTGRFLPGESWPNGMPLPTWDVNDLDSLQVLSQQEAIL